MLSHPKQKPVAESEAVPKRTSRPRVVIGRPEAVDMRLLDCRASRTDMLAPLIGRDELGRANPVTGRPVIFLI